MVRLPELNADDWRIMLDGRGPPAFMVDRRPPADGIPEARCSPRLNVVLVRTPLSADGPMDERPFIAFCDTGPNALRRILGLSSCFRTACGF